MVAEAGAGIFGQQRDTLTKKKTIVVDSVLIPGGHRKRYLGRVGCHESAQITAAAAGTGPRVKVWGCKDLPSAVCPRGGIMAGQYVQVMVRVVTGRPQQ